MDVDNFELKNIISSLDDNNKNLIDEIQKSVPVEFRIWGETWYSAIIKKDSGIPKRAVVLYNEPISQEKIAHELLHCKCGLLLGDATCIFIKTGTLYDMIINNNFMDHLQNSIEHKIIYDDYISMGYEPEKFFVNIGDPKSKVEQFKQLLSQSNINNVTMITNYLQLCFYLMSFPIDNRCKPLIKEVKTIQYPLFHMVKELIDSVKDVLLEPSNNAFVQEKYQCFGDRLYEWLKNNQKQITLI